MAKKKLFLIAKNWRGDLIEQAIKDTEYELLLSGVLKLWWRDKDGKETTVYHSPNSWQSLEVVND